MGTVWVREFRGGLDLRRIPETSPGGTLLRALDGHINSGGEFEQRSDFVLQTSLPISQTRGLARTPSGLYVFGHQASVPGLPAGISYQQLAHPSGLALVDVPVATLFNSKIYAIGTFSNGSSYLFYDGTRISDANAPPNASGSTNPRTILTHVQKAFAGAGPNLFFSAVTDATDFGAGAGSGEGVVDMSTHSQGSEELTALAPYDQYLAVFADRTIQIWYFEPDPALSRKTQILGNTGTTATRSVTQFGDEDVFYLDRAGIRSLRARDSSNSAATQDIGSPVDPLILAALDTLTEEEVRAAIGVIEPRNGRFWLILGDTIYVLSYFRNSKVSAWSTYQPGFTIDDVVIHENVMWLRSGDDLYTFGDATGKPVYSDGIGEMWSPYLDGDEPARAKNVEGFDAALRGLWEVRFAYAPQEPNVSDLIGRFEGTTFGGGDMSAIGSATHISVRFRNLAAPSASSPAKVSSFVVHFDRDPDEDSA